jgi:NAD+ kinase
VKRVGLVLKRTPVDAGDAQAIARELVSGLVARGCEVFAAEENTPLEIGAVEVPELELAGRIELLVAIGGDGTLLRAAGLVADHGVPVLGINLGRLGFLVPFDPHEAADALARALDGKLPLEERMRLRVALHRPGGGAPTVRGALNDAVISQGAMARILELHAALDGQKIALYKADGLIVSTPTGSTAYNLAAGGPILTPGQSAMAVTPICPHMLTNRPLVVPSTARVTVEIGGERDAVLTVDGQWAHSVAPGDRVEISRADKNLKLYRSEKTYFEILREKLKWGEHALR